MALMDQTKQLPAPATSALPLVVRWRRPVLNGIAEICSRFAEVCLHPVIVLPLLFGLASESNGSVGRAIALVLAASILSGVVALALAADRWAQLRLLSAVVLTALAALLLLGLGIARNWLNTNNGGPGAATIIPLLLIALCIGGAGSLRVTMAAITRAEGSWRTRWGRWVILGLIGTVLGGLAARQALAHVTTAFVNSFGQLFTIAGLAMFVGALSLAALLALNWRRTTDEQSGQFTVLAIPELLTNNLAYDRFLFFRLLYACGALADPFFILYATQELKAGGRAIAAYLLTLVLARAVATIGWRTLSSTAGNPLVLQLATFVRIIAPLTALTLPPLLSSATLRDHLPGGDSVNLIVFGAVFAAWGIASAGLDLAAPAIQGALTTPRERIAAQIVTGLVLALGTVAFPIGGLLLDRVGYSILFIIALLCGLVTLLAGGLLDEPGVLVLRSAPTERPALRRRNVHREG